MKKSINLIALALVMLFTACESKTKKENRALQEKVIELQQENEAYKSQSVKMTASIADYKKFLKEINNNLKEIDLSSSMVGKLNKEVNKDEDLKKSIRTRVTRIVELVQNSKLKIMALDSKLNELRRTSNAQSGEILDLDQQLKKATKDLMEKEAAFIELTTTQDELEELYNEQMAITQELRTILNRVYYFNGTSKEIRESGIINKEGGFIGIGRVKILNANASDTLFVRLEKNLTDSVVINSKNIKLISKHTSDSYEIRKNNYRHVLIITDKQSFWSQGNYLVVQKD